MQRQKLSQEYCCLLVRDNTNNNHSMNQETLDSQNQTIQIIKNYTTITRLILEFMENK